jgi:hypothetical protein
LTAAELEACGFTALELKAAGLSKGVLHGIGARCPCRILCHDHWIADDFEWYVLPKGWRAPDNGFGGDDGSTRD